MFDARKVPFLRAPQAVAKHLGWFDWVVEDHREFDKSWATMTVNADLYFAFHWLPELEAKLFGNKWLNRVLLKDHDKLRFSVRK